MKVRALCVAALFVGACVATPQSTPRVEPITSASTAVASTTTDAVFTIGDRVRDADNSLYLTLAEVAKNHAPAAYNDQPKLGETLVSFRVIIEGIAKGGTDYNIANFKARDQEGFEYIWDTANDQVLGYGTLKPGAKVQGWVSFYVPQTTSRLTLIYTPSPLSKEPIEFEVTL